MKIIVLTAILIFLYIFINKYNYRVEHVENFETLGYLYDSFSKKDIPINLSHSLNKNTIVYLAQDGSTVKMVTNKGEGRYYNGNINNFNSNQWLKYKSVGTRFTHRVDSMPIIQIKSLEKHNLCLDDGGVTKSGQSYMHLWNCDPNNKNQHFIYNPKLKQLKNPNKNLCIDDGGGTRAGQTKYLLYTCDPNNKNQQFIYDSKTKMFKNPNKRNLCMDDGGALDSSGRVKTVSWNCENTNRNQKFTMVPITPKPYIYIKGDQNKAKTVCKKLGKRLCKEGEYCNNKKPIYKIDEADKWGVYPEGWIQLGKNGDVCKTVKQNTNIKNKEVAVLCCDSKYIPLVIDAIHIGNNNELTFFKGDKYQTITPSSTLDVKNIKMFRGLTNNFKNGNIDAITITNSPNSSLWFKGKYVMTYDNIKSIGVETNISNYFSGLPDYFKDGNIDAVSTRGSRTEYMLFKKTKYCAIDMNTNKCIAFGNISDKFKFPNEFKLGYLDCILYSKPNVSYIMKNDKLIEYNFLTNSTIKNPVDISSVWTTLLPPFIPKNKVCIVYEKLMKTDKVNKEHWKYKYYKECKHISKKEYKTNMKSYLDIVNQYKNQYFKENNDRKHIESEITKYEKNLKTKQLELQKFKMELDKIKNSKCSPTSSNRPQIIIYGKKPTDYYTINPESVENCIPK